jgi:hypothetical protein
VAVIGDNMIDIGFCMRNMFLMTQTKRAIVYAIESGYTITKDGVLMSPPIPPHVIEGYVNTSHHTPYREVGFKLPGSKNVVIVRLHKLVAYVKFGNIVFEPGVVVRHLDGNSMNNSLDNIDIGSNYDNVKDRIAAWYVK